MKYYEKRYLQFPIMLLKKIHINYDEAMEDIISFAIVHYALKQNISQQDAAKQALYSYYRGNGLKELYNIVNNYMIYNQIDYDEDYNGFAGNSFNPEDGINDVLKLFEDDRNFYDLALKNCQLSKTDEFFGITGPSSEVRLKKFNDIKKLVDQHQQKFGPEPMPTIEKSLFFDFKEKPDPILFSAYIAIRSLQGQKPFVATTRNVILMRMLGAKSNKALKNHLKTKYVADIHHRFTRSEKAIRYNFDKLFNALLSRGLLRSKIFERSVSRKIFLSTTIDHEQLANKIIEFAQKKKYRSIENDARQKIRKATQ